MIGSNVAFRPDTVLKLVAIFTPDKGSLIVCTSINSDNGNITVHIFTSIVHWYDSCTSSNRGTKVVLKGFARSCEEVSCNS